MARNDIQAIDVGGVDGITDIRVVDDSLMYIAINLAYIYSQSTVCVCLWVSVNN